MARIEDLRSKAKQLEAKQNWRAAIDAWASVVAHQESGKDADSQDLSAYNRLGDLHLKVGDPATAADCFERAVDRYTDSGFDANAIALCNKVLRYAPGRTQVYFKLAKLMARRGFIGEAKQHFLYYAERMQKAGKLDEAVAALRELTRLAPEAAELTALLDRFGAGPRRSQVAPAAGDDLEASEEPEAKSSRRRTKSLIFLDVDEREEDQEEAAEPTRELPFLDPHGAGAPPRAAQEAPPAPPAEPASAPGLEFTALVDETEPEDAGVPPIEGLESHLIEDFEEIRRESGPVEYIGSAGRDEPADVAPLPGLEPTAAEPEDAAPTDLPPPLEVDEDDRVELVQAFSASEVGTSPDMGLDLGTEGVTSDSGLLDADDVDPGLMAAEVVDDLGVEGIRNVSGEAAGEILMEFQASPAPRSTTVEALEDRVLNDPGDPEAHRALAEALIERGDRDRGLDELDIALRRYVEWGELPLAREIGQEILHLEPNNVRVLQKLVEVAYRDGDRGKLVAAYLELGDALFRNGALTKALAVYERVLEDEPQNARALAALAILRPPEEPKADMREAKVMVRSDVPSGAGGEFVDLGALIVGDPEPRDTRLRVEDEAPTGDEERDFAEMLEQFRRGIDESLGQDDFQAHYDLGVAFKEMGLLDDAIAEFQKALRGQATRLQSHEELGACFFEKGQYPVAEAILQRGLDLPASGDQERVGILYWLGRALEAQRKGSEALELYRRVFAVDIRFHDVEQRVRALARAGA